MVGSAFVEVCGSIIFGLTRSVAEHYDPNGVECDPETFGFHLLESTGLDGTVIPLTSLFSKSTVTENSAEVLFNAS